MKITAPDGTVYYLSDKAKLEERVETINRLINKYRDVCEDHWFSLRVKYFLDKCSTYLISKMNEENKEDKEVLSIKKMKKMVRGTKEMTTFSGLSLEEKYHIGLIDKFDKEGYQSA